MLKFPGTVCFHQLSKREKVYSWPVFRFCLHLPEWAQAPPVIYGLLSLHCSPCDRQRLLFLDIIVVRFSFPVANNANASKHSTQSSHTGPTGPHVFFPIPGKVQMLTPQSSSLHVHSKADTQVRMSWKEGEGPWPFHQWQPREWLRRAQFARLRYCLAVTESSVRLMLLHSLTHPP